MYSYESILPSVPDCSTAPVSDFLGRYLPYLLRKADQTLSAPFYAVLARAGVARSEWRLLSVLEALGDLRVAGAALTRALSADAAMLEAKALAGADGIEELAQRLQALTSFVESRVAAAVDDEVWAG